MSKEVKLEKCRCGRKAKVISTLGGNIKKLHRIFRVRCKSCGCWLEPWRRTKPGAIKAWNSVMRRK